MPIPKTQVPPPIEPENTPRLVAIKWFTYAESALREDVEPTLLSAGPLSWVQDTQRELGIKPGRICDQLLIADRAINEVIKIAYKTPLSYPRTSQYLVRRAMRR